MTRSSMSVDLSTEPSIIRSLTGEQKQRLTELLDRYLTGLESDLPPNASQLLADNPDLAEPLTGYLKHLEALHDVAAGFGRGGHETHGEFEIGEAQPDERRLGDFILQREIGRGGMGVVYEARQISLGRQVAIKLLPFAAVLDSNQIARFKNEAQAAAQLQHPNIVPVFAIGVERGVHYYAMRLIDGQPLDRAISQLRQSPESEALVCPPTEPFLPDRYDSLDREGSVSHVDAPSTKRSILTEHSESRRDYYRAVAALGIQAAEALHAAHDYGVVHRDIKPSNLLLDQESKIWITDFGLARCQSDVTLTKTGDLLGTLRYMSPEQALGQSAFVDHRTDIYSLGITLYELLTLSPAFDGENSPALLRQIENDEPLPIRQIQSDVPVDLETVVLTAMSKARDDRYATAQDFAADLQRFLDGRPTIAKPPALFERAAKWARRHKQIVTAALSACLLLILGLSVSTVMIARAKTEAQASSQRARDYYRDAKEAVDLGLDLSEELRNIAGAQNVRQRYLETVIEAYQRFAAQESDDPALRAETALTLSKIGTIHNRIGSKEDAIAAYLQAIHGFQEAIATEPDDLEHRRHLALCHNNLGLLYVDVGDVAKASRAYGEAIAVQQKLVAKERTNTQYRADLALSHNNLGLVQAHSNQITRAEESYRAAIEIQRSLVTDDPDNPGYARALAGSFQNMSSLLAKTSPEEAIMYNQKAQEIYVKLGAKNPDVLELQHSRAILLNNLGTILLNGKKIDEAEDCHRQAIEILEQLTNKEPSFTSYRADLALSYNRLGRVQSQRGDDAAAIETYKTAIYWQDMLVRQDPRNATVHSTLGGIYHNLAVLLERAKQYENAAEALRHAIKLQRVAHEAAPQWSAFRDHLSQHYVTYGQVLRQLGRAEEAAQTALQRKALWPGNPEKLLSITQEIAKSVKLMEADAVGRRSAATYAALAASTLREAVDAGLTLPAKSDYPDDLNVFALYGVLSDIIAN